MFKNHLEWPFPTSSLPPLSSVTPIASWTGAVLAKIEYEWEKEAHVPLTPRRDEKRLLDLRF